MQSPARTAIFTDRAGSAIPDPAVYGDWFHRADQKRRRLAVGTRRYSAARDALGREPHYEELVDPETGALLTIDELQRESPAARHQRVAKVRMLVTQRREMIRQTATFGFVGRTG